MNAPPATARRGRPRQRNAEGGLVREEQIVALAAALFAEKGYDATSLREIAEAAGITKAALYYWFPEKESLLQRVVAGRLERLVAHANAAADAEPTAIGKVRAFLAASASHLDNDRDAWVASSNTFWANFDSSQKRSVIANRDRYEKALRALVDQAMQTGALRQADAGLATRLLLSAMNYLPRWHRPDGPLTAEDVMHRYLDLVLDGLRPRD